MANEDSYNIFSCLTEKEKARAMRKGKRQAKVYNFIFKVKRVIKCYLTKN